MWKKTPVQIMARFAPEYKLTGLKLQVILIMWTGLGYIYIYIIAICLSPYKNSSIEVCLIIL